MSKKTKSRRPKAAKAAVRRKGGAGRRRGIDAGKVLAILKGKKGEFVSAKKMAAKLDMSPGAIRNRVNKLREEGTRITGVRKQGYKLG